MVKFINEGTSVAARCMPIQPKIPVLFESEIVLHDIKQPSHCRKEKNLEKYNPRVRHTEVIDEI